MHFEVCTDDVDQAKEAEALGAHRVELCSALELGGLTPSMGLLQAMREETKLGIHVMIRPRAGDFLYTEKEFGAMQRDVALAMGLGADGIVLGMLTKDGLIDQSRMRMIMSIAGSLEVTFHRAFDVCADSEEALDDLINLGVTRLLTSGCAATAPSGKETIAQLVQQSQGQIQIMAGCGVGPANVRDLVQRTGINDVHFTCRKRVPSKMVYRNETVSMGSDSEEYLGWGFDHDKFNGIYEALR